MKDDIDIGVAEHRLRANRFDVRGSQQTGNNRVGHLVFDDIGWLSGPGCVDDHLHVRDVWQCIQRNMLERPDASQCQQQDSGEDHEAIARASIDDFGEHHMPPVAFTRNCFVASTSPFFWTVMATCHVPPEPREPLPSYKPLPLSVSFAVVFIAPMLIAAIEAM